MLDFDVMVPIKRTIPLLFHVRRYHRNQGTSGHVWQGRYKSFIVQNDEHLLTVARYVEGNPVRAGMVESAKEWKWSSHMETTGDKERRITDAFPVTLPINWSNYVDSPLTDKKLARLRQGVNHQSPYGILEWVADICKRLGLESTIRKRGRPRDEGFWGRTTLSY